MTELREWSEFLADYDLPPYEGDVRTYLVATTQRTGSHHLAQLLAGTGAVGVPFEYLNGYRVGLECRARGWVDDESTHVKLSREMVERRTGMSGWFGLKAHWHTWVGMSARPRVRDLVRPERFLYLTRGDRVAQAASLALAEQTQVWVNPGCAAARPPVYAATHIRDALLRIEQECEAWEGFFLARGIDVLRMSYEELLADPEVCIDAVFAHLGTPRTAVPPRALPRLNARADDLVESWSARYRDEVVDT